MKVAFLIPRIHIAACVALRPWILSDARDQVLLLTTPKLAGAKSSPLSKARKILGESGFSYLWNQVQMTRRYRALAESEVSAGVALQDQLAPSPESLARSDGVRRVDILSIKSKEARRVLEEFAPDVMAAVFFNQIVGPKALAIPSKAALNVHPSLLPEYRGISPIFRVLLNQEEDTGASVHAMHQKIDFGDLYAQERLKIDPSDSYYGLYQRVASAAGEALKKTLLAFASDNPPEAIAQNGEASYFGPILKAEEKAFRKRAKRKWWHKQDFRPRS